MVVVDIYIRYDNLRKIDIKLVVAYSYKIVVERYIYFIKVY